MLSIAGVRVRVSLHLSMVTKVDTIKLWNSKLRLRWNPEKIIEVLTWMQARYHIGHQLQAWTEAPKQNNQD